MANKQYAPIVANPVLFDRIIGEMQKGLTDNLGWLDVAFGRAQRVVKPINGKRYYTPCVYAGGTPWVGNNDYFDVTPDANIGSFCFFWIDDPQNMDWQPNIQGSIKTEFSVIFWLDLRKVYPNDPTNRNTEALKAEILRVMNGGYWKKSGTFRINRIYELAENIYRGFTLDEIDNQFLMHPYAGFRFTGEMSIDEPCNI